MGLSNSLNIRSRERCIPLFQLEHEWLAFSLLLWREVWKICCCLYYIRRNAHRCMLIWVNKLPLSWASMLHIELHVSVQLNEFSVNNWWTFSSPNARNGLKITVSIVFMWDQCFSTLWPTHNIEFWCHLLILQIFAKILEEKKLFIIWYRHKTDKRERNFWYNFKSLMCFLEVLICLYVHYFFLGINLSIQVLPFLFCRVSMDCLLNQAALIFSWHVLAMKWNFFSWL